MSKFALNIKLRFKDGQWQSTNIYDPLEAVQAPVWFSKSQVKFRRKCFIFLLQNQFYIPRVSQSQICAK